MRLSLSVRIAETETKDRLTIEFDKLCRLAIDHGYHAVCLRPSVIGSSPSQPLHSLRRTVTDLGLTVSMVTTDIAVPLNNDHGPDSLRDIAPHLDVAVALGANIIRICMKHEDDIPIAQRAADQARERGIRLAHQCHTDSLFETVTGSLAVIHRVARSNFGLIYEPANLMLCGEDYGPMAITKLAPHIMNVYVQNHRMNATGKTKLPTRVRGDVHFEPVPLWAPGGVDFSAVFDGLAKNGYDGFVTVHQAYAELMNPREAAAKSAEYLRQVAPLEKPIPARNK